MLRISLLALVVLIASAALGKGDRDTALALARSAEVMAEEGKLDEAVALFVKAYDLDPAPALLYNIGRLCDKKGDLVRAREYYERYIAAEKDAKNVAKAKARLEAVLSRVPGKLVVVCEPRRRRWTWTAGRRWG